jgi:hypothetical protein
MTRQRTPPSAYQKAGLPRAKTVHWNVIPGWNGKIEIKAGEIEHGVKALKALLALLPKLRAVVFVGKKAWLSTNKEVRTSLPK